MTKREYKIESTDGELGPVVSELFDCPNCHAETFECVNDGEMTNFLCLSCHMCWHWELNYLSAVDPRTCPGCHNLPRCMEQARRTQEEFEALDPKDQFVRLRVSNPAKYRYPG